MPLIEFKGFEPRFRDPEVAEELIRRLTDAVADQFGRDVADETWVLVEGVDPARWGFAGETRTGGDGPK